MKIVAVVPIKLNNERLPNKNTKLLGNKPLITYCLETLQKIEEIDSIYVYCSNEDIICYLPDGVSFLKRPQYLDSPESNFTQIFEMFRSVIMSDIYVYAHATAPFVDGSSIEGGISAVVSGRYDSAFCAERIQDFLWLNGKPLNFNPQNLPRSQDLPTIFRETSGVYVFSKETFEKHHSRIGIRPFIIEVSRKEAIDINTASDFSLAEMFLDYTVRKECSSIHESS